MPKRTISVVTGCLNEVGNIEEFCRQVRSALDQIPWLEAEVVIADNGSSDGTRDVLRRLAEVDPKLKVLFNSRNFGPVNSGYNALLQATGDAVILMACDLQDPPALIPELIRKWEEGFKVVVTVKNGSREHPVIFVARTAYYRLLRLLSGSDQVIPNFTGFGLYDRAFLNVLRRFSDPVPYLRGFVTEIGFRYAEVSFIQPVRQWGRSKQSLGSLYGIALGGLAHHTTFPLRVATLTGFGLAGVSLLVALGYLVYKLLYWDTFVLGLAPLIVGMFFFSAIQLIFIGIVGEYVGIILRHLKRRPYAVIEEAINCPNPDA